MKIFQLGLSPKSICFLEMERVNVAAWDMQDVQDERELMDAISLERSDLVIANLAETPWLERSLPRMRRASFTQPVIGLDYPRRESWPLARASFLNAGGDDLLPLPEHPDELLASSRAVMRRYQFRSSDEREFVVNGARLAANVRTHSVTLNGISLELSPMEQRLLLTLIESNGEVCDIRELTSRIYRFNEEPEGNSLQVFIRRIRKQLDEIDPGASGLIKTVRGFGYQLVSA